MDAIEYEFRERLEKLEEDYTLVRRELDIIRSMAEIYLDRIQEANDDAIR